MIVSDIVNNFVGYSAQRAGIHRGRPVAKALPVLSDVTFAADYQPGGELKEDRSMLRLIIS